MVAMFLSRPRAAVIGAAIVTLALTACAPPGQPGAPGVAATYEGVEITNVQIDAIQQAWVDDTQGQDVAERRQILTIELLHDDLLAKAAELGYPVALSTAKTYADQWIIFEGQEGEASEETVHATQGILALYIVALTDPTLATLTEISDKVAGEVVASPRSGTYSTETLLNDVKTAMQTAEEKGLGSQYSYTEFQNVAAFTVSDREWIDDAAAS
jgi:hypothetical protein